jgi:hypothetical protein
MASTNVTVVGVPVDQPSMLIPGELRYRETDAPGNAKYGPDEVNGYTAARKGNRAPFGPRAPGPVPFKGVR